MRYLGLSLSTDNGPVTFSRLNDGPASGEPDTELVGVQHGKPAKQVGCADFHGSILSLKQPQSEATRDEQG